MAGTLITDIRNIRSIPACVAPTETPREWIVCPSLRSSSRNELSTCRTATIRSGRPEGFFNQRMIKNGVTVSFRTIVEMQRRKVEY
jgi:hypothetical protein